MEIRYIFDENQPQGTFSTANFRNMFRALFENDIAPLRVRASMFLDMMEYASDAAAQDEYSGTGITISSNSADKQEGTYCLQCVIDATGNRKVTRSKVLNLSAFGTLKLWERCSVASSAIQFYLRDSSGNESYWDITTDGTVNTWKQDSLDLTTPDSNNGTNATLSDIVEFGFLGLDASTTYLFDTIKAIVAMVIAIETSNQGNGFYKQVYVTNNQPLDLSSQASPTITAPSSNPRIDILYINSSGSLAWIQGSEGASPTPDYSSLPVGALPICLVYCRPTMTKVVDYEDKDSFPNDGYIYADIRPFLNVGIRDFLGLIDTPSSYSGQGTKVVRVNVAEDALEFVTLTSDFLGLTDTPSSYSGQGNKYVGVKSAEDGLEFKTAPADEKVKADASDPTPDYLDGKVDNAGIEVNASDKLQLKDNGVTYSKLLTAIPKNIQLFTSSGTWTKPAGVDKVYVKVWGAGGGGGGWGSSGANHGAGGGGGGYSEGIIGVTSNVTVTIGAGGAGGSANNPGSAGGLSSFAGTATAQGNGGAGGESLAGNGGAGGAASGGDVNITGQQGDGATHGVSPGAGGNSPFGGAGQKLGAEAIVPIIGGGGRGGHYTDYQMGGNGANGMVIVYY